MKSFTLAFTIAILACAVLTEAQRGLRKTHRSLAHGRLQRAEVLPLQERAEPGQSQSRQLQKRCKPRAASSAAPSASASAANVTSSIVLTSAVAVPTNAPATTSPPDKATSTSTTAAAPTTSSTGTAPSSGHQFTLTNKCSNSVQPVIADTKCGYSPRCAGASSYSGPQPGSLASGASQTVTINDDWVGRIFAQNAKCGVSGEDCTMAEFNLDSGSSYTPQAYDISNIQGFTQSMSVGADGCSTATCTNANCGCENAYAVGDLTGCGSDLPVKACGAGNIGFTIVFCP